jgi:DnaJ-class molecular chaperone
MTDSQQDEHIPSPEKPQPCSHFSGSGVVVAGRSIVRGQDIAWSYWCQPCGGTGLVAAKEVQS